MTGIRDEVLTVHRFGGFTVETATFRLMRGGVPLKIEPKALEVLTYLIERRERVVAKQELLDDLWKGTSVTENALTRTVAQIRKVLGDDLQSPRFIQTIPTRGYRFIAELDKNEVPVPSPGESGKRVAEGRVRGSRVAPVIAIFAGLLAAALIIVMITASGGNKVRRDANAAEPPPIAARPLAPAALLQAFPSFSPDGTSIAYSGDDNGTPHIYTRPIGGGDERKVTSGDGESQPAWSPDGKTIAFVSARDGGIWTVPASGGTPDRLTPFGSRPAWSPNGSEIAYQSGEQVQYGWTAFEALPPSTVWIVNVNTKHAATLTNAGTPSGGHGAPSWRPDGMRLAFSSCDLERCGIFTVARDGSAIEQLVTDSRRLASPVFTRDGRSIVYVLMRYNDSLLLSIQIDPGGQRMKNPTRLRQTIPGVMQHVAISGDGSRFAWTHVEETSDLFTMAIGANSDAPKRLTRNATLRSTFPAYSPDGMKIAYCAVAAGQDSGVWVADADGRNAKALDVGPGLKQYTQWARSGWDVFYTAWHGTGPAVFKTSLITGQTANVAQLPKGASVTQVSPDETAVAYTRTINGSTSVWLNSMIGQKERRLTRDQDLARFPVWSPSGKFIAVAMTTHDGDSAIGVIPATGGSIQIVTSGRGETLPHSWSPDEKEIAYASRRNGLWDIYRVPVDGGDPQRITGNDEMKKWFRSPAWSPDGRRILYESGEPKGNIWVSEPRLTR